MNYKIVVASYNCPDKIGACIDSITAQEHSNFQLLVVDDASPDPAHLEEIRGRGVDCIVHKHNTGALYSQYEAIESMNPHPDDVIVFVDGDDRLAHGRVLKVLDRYYDKGALLTYGSYRTEPYSNTCLPARRYPAECERNNDYRNAHRWGLRFNHLRTVKYDLFRRLQPKYDLRDRAGRWYRVAGDSAVMIPCLEMANGRYVCIKDVLYVYTSDNPLSDWRSKAKLIDSTHHRILNTRRMDPV